MISMYTPSFQLYELSPDPKRKEFLDDLFNFMQKRGSPVNRIPIMAKQVLDLYELYRLVVTRGGLVEVINKKLWREITKGLHLPSSITSAAFTLRTQYMKYLYPYECEKLGLSTPSELQAAIDGNRREARRSSYSFEYPVMMGPGPSSSVSASTGSQQLPSASLAGGFSHHPPPPHPPLPPHHPLLPPPPSGGAPLLPPGLLVPPGFPQHQPASSSSSRNGSILPDSAFFGFPSMMTPAAAPSLPALSPSAPFEAKPYIDGDQSPKHKRTKCPQRCLSSSSASMVTFATSPKPRPNSKPNYSSPATLETDPSRDTNRHSKPIRFPPFPKCTSAFDLDKRGSPQAISSPHLSHTSSAETGLEGQPSTAARFSEFLKHRTPQHDATIFPSFNLARSELVQNAYRQFLGAASHKFASTERKESINGCAEDRRQLKSTGCRENHEEHAHKVNGQMAGEHQHSTMQVASNLRISTQAGSQLGLPDNTLVVCMEVTGVVYQGVLFGQVKPPS
uniref:ARID domain-containing protein n=1 Tax=Mesocestoides corti TaxID=53468 RepID=A0A5K3EGS5_MESCO